MEKERRERHPRMAWIYWLTERRAHAMPASRCRAQKKNPAVAGFSTHCRVDHSAGVMFEAWAPFGPWVTS